MRYCGDCKLHVYNLAEMNREEVAALVREKTGRICGRLFLRGDHTAATRDCRLGRARQKLRRWVGAAAWLLIGTSAIFGWKSTIENRRSLPPLFRTAIDWVLPQAPVRYDVMGDVCPLPTPAPLPVPAPPSPDPTE